MISKEDIIRNRNEEFEKLVSLELKKKASKEQIEFLYKNIDLWEIFLTAIYAKLNNALAINDIDYRNFMESDDDINDSFIWKKRALFFKSVIQKKISEVKLLLSERNKEISKNERHYLTEDVRSILNLLMEKLK